MRKKVFIAKDSEAWKENDARDVYKKQTLQTQKQLPSPAPFHTMLYISAFLGAHEMRAVYNIFNIFTNHD